MLVLFHIGFALAIAKRYWDHHKNDFIIKALAAVLLPKNEPKETLSLATRTASRTILIPYKFQDVDYEVILPVRRKKLNWQSCIAQIEVTKDSHKSVEARDVTDQVKRLAGPYLDFFGLHQQDLKAHQIVRNALQLSFFNQKGTEVLTIKSE